MNIHSEIQVVKKLQKSCLGVKSITPTFSLENQQPPARTPLCLVEFGMPPQNLSAYGSSKAGLNHLTRLLAAELGPMGIRVNSVSPGTTMTEIAEKVFENKELVQANIAATPLGRVGMPIDIAKVICYLASDEADWVTGQIVDATGGYHMAL